MEKKNTLEDKLKKYTALAGGLTAVAGAVNAQVVYTDVNPDTVVSGNGSMYAVDFNNDAITDVTFTTNVNNTSWSSYGYGGVSSTNTVNVSLPALGANEGWLGNAGKAQNVTAGAAIGGSGAFATGTGMLGYMKYYSTMPFGSTGQAPNGNFLGVEGYVGVKFDIGGSAHYGWVRLSVSADGTTLTVKDFAYDATAGTAINAGDVGPMGAPTFNQISNILCAGDSTASIVAIPSGGAAPYTFSWTDASMNVVGTNDTLSGVPAGTYEVTITDGMANTISASFTVTQPMAMAGSTVSTDEILGNDGAINLSVNGGVAPYSFSWNSGPTTEDLSGLTVGTYIVTVTDQNGCTIAVTDSVVNGAMSAPGISEDSSIMCSGDSTAMLTATPNGASAPYSYIWTNAAGDTVGTAQSVSGLPAGTYTVEITSANTAVASGSFTITEPTALGVTSVTTNETAGNDGGVDITVTGGTTPYSYMWDNSATTEDLTNVAGGIYSVTVTDNNGCTVSLTDTVVSTVGIEDNIFEIAKVFPNPTKGALTIQLNNVNGEVEITLMDITGKILSKESRMNPNSVELDMSSFVAGIYSVILKTENNVSELKVIKE